MAAKKRNTKKNFQKKLFITDERIPKLLGVLILLLGVYLFIAFTSYIFTWRHDNDLVHNNYIGLLTDSSQNVNNWLGKLGAISSDFFFSWLFGLPSYILVVVMAVGGIALVKRTPLDRVWRFLRTAIILMLFFSILLEFAFGYSKFSWGGAFGKGVCDTVTDFVGSAGMLALIIFALLGVVIWIFNPNFNEFTWNKAKYDVKNYFQDLFSGRIRKRRTLRQKKAKEAAELEAKIAAEKELAAELAKQKAKEVAELQAKAKAEGKLLLELDESSLSPEIENNDNELEIEVNDTPKNSEVISNNPALENTAALQGNKDHQEPYDPTLELSSYEKPVLPLLIDYENEGLEIDRAELEANKDQIIETLLNYKVEIKKIKATIGPTVTLYEIVPDAGVRVSKIKNLEDDIALSLAALGIRIIAPIPGKGTIGIEVPNKKKKIVSLKEVLSSDKFRKAKMDLPLALGKTISNEVFVADLAKMPHLLIAGATGQGKSVGINTILMSLLYKKHPSQVKLVLIDPKKVELFPYSKIENHFLAYLPGEDEPITTETNKVIHTLNSLCIEMDQRYDLLKKAHARNITEYNQKFVARKLNPLNGHRFMPFFVLIIDEFADLIMTAGKDIELPIGRLAQLARAVGIHLVIATQRPSVNIITGVIKANFPARMAFKVTSKIDSRTILDQSGAEQLIGRGDMLLSFGTEAIRLQCAFVDTPEVENVIDFIHKQRGYPEPHFLPEFHGDDEEFGTAKIKLSELDEHFEDSARLVVQRQSGSTSMLQRTLKLGYNRAGRIMDQLEAFGIVGPSEGSKPREVLFYDEVELMKYLESVKNKNG